MPRFSSGCRNCVGRHVRCDERKPTCKNCELAGLSCKGPREGAVFVNTAHDYSQGSWKTRSIKTNRGTSSLGRRSPQASVANDNKYATTINASLDWSKSDIDTPLCFLLQNWGSEDRVWIEHCTTRRGMYPTADLAIAAFAAAFYGNRRCHQSSLDLAMSKYGTALISLRHELDNFKKDHLFDVLAATTALNRFEALNCTVHRGWVQHAGGISKIVLLSGPETFVHHPNRAILDCNRFKIIHEAYCRRRRTFLQQDEWKSLRTPTTPVEDHFFKLQDLYCDLAEVAAAVTRVLQGNALGAAETQHATHLVERLIANLDEWAGRWTSHFNCAPSEVHNSTKDSFYSDSGGLVFKNSLHYPNRKAAMGLNMYFSLKLTALEWKEKFEHSEWWAGDQNQNMVDIPQARQMARDICRSLHCHFSDHPQSRVQGVYHFLFAAAVAHKGFHRRSRESRWLRGLFLKAANESGIELARNLTVYYQNKWSPSD